MFESVKFALSWFISPLQCLPRMDRTLAAEEQDRQQDGGSAVHPWRGAIMTKKRSSYYKGILHSRTLQVSEEKKIYFFQIDYLKKKCEVWSFIFPRLMWQDITTMFPQPRSTGPQPAWDVKGRHGTLREVPYRWFQDAYALVNVNKKTMERFTML